LCSEFYIDWFTDVNDPKKTISWDDFINNNDHWIEFSSIDQDPIKVSPGERIGQLINWAIYYTACAILYVYTLASTDKRDDSTLHIFDISDQSGSTIAEWNPIPLKNVGDWFRNFDRGTTEWVSGTVGIYINLFNSSFILLTPLLGLVAVIAAKDIFKELWESLRH